MSFIFSHEVRIFRVQQNLAKWSSRILKRLFDIIGSLSIITLLSPVLLYISLKVKKMEARQYMVMKGSGKEVKPLSVWKFRSMVINSKEVLEELLNNDINAREEWNLTFKLKTTKNN
ncbi:sugar transferase [Klebsiella pneumoniae]|uniref:sugar transferase n=1 Tax=Klebsiella pneumoniae TaxID=573 RepID=UPI003A5D1A93